MPRTTGGRAYRSAQEILAQQSAWTSGGADKFAGAARLQARLVAAGCQLLVPMGTSEVELEGVDVAVLPWADAAARAFEQRLALRLEALAAGPPAPTPAATAEAAPPEASRAPAETNGRCETEAPDGFAIGMAAQEPRLVLEACARSKPLLVAALLGIGSLLVLRAGRR